MLTHLNLIYIKCLYSIHILSTHVIICSYSIHIACTRIAILSTLYVNIVYTSYAHASQSYLLNVYMVYILIILQFEDKRLLIL